MRIGLLGGTFNPIHNGHLNLAEGSMRALSLEKVIFVPAHLPPHKRADNLLEAEKRLRMIELALKGKGGLEVSRHEIDRRQISYTIDTIKYFKGLYPEGTEIFFLIGADSLEELKSWKDIEELSGLCSFVVGERPGFSGKKKYPWLKEVNITPVEVSSSQIRKRIRQGQEITGLLPKAVEDYIKQNRLYK